MSLRIEDTDKQLKEKKYRARERCCLKTYKIEENKVGEMGRFYILNERGREVCNGKVNGKRLTKQKQMGERMDDLRRRSEGKKRKQTKQLLSATVTGRKTFLNGSSNHMCITDVCMSA